MASAFLEQTARRIGLGVAGIALTALLAACGSSGVGSTGVSRAAFTSKEFGVGVSPRVTTAEYPKRGGGRYLVGKPYTVRGRTFTPSEDADYVATGHASWYGADFHGRLTANGEIFSKNAITGAHPTLPLPSYVRVTNLANNRSLLVRINDRGPFLAGRVIDLSHKAADMLGYVNQGTADVRVEYVSPAPLEGDDTRYLMASLTGPAGIEQMGSTRIASAEPGGPSNVVDMVGDMFGGMFGYAEGQAAISSAHAAAEAMATRAPELAEWKEAVDDDARALRWQLGVFTDFGRAQLVETEFARIGAVDYEEVNATGRPAIRLTLSHLKPGVGREDALDLARTLGLDDLILY